MHTNGFAHAVGAANYDCDLIPLTSYSESSASDITLLMCVVNFQGFLSNDKNYSVGTQEVLEFRKNFFLSLSSTLCFLKKLTKKTSTRKFSVLYDTDSAGCACKSGDMKTEFLLLRKDKY